MQHKLLLTLATICLYSTAALAQITKPIAAPSDERAGLYAITADKVYVTPDRVVENATVLVRDGRIINVGTSIAIPDGAVRVDAAGKTIVAAFIDPISSYAQPDIDKEERNWYRVQYDTKTPGPYAWNQALKPEYDAAAHLTPNDDRAKQLREMGFGAVLSHRPDGISRGSAALVALSDKPVQEALIIPQAAHVMSFSKGSSHQAYPSSLMGMIALLRQTYLDAEWYENGGSKEERNLSLEAWNNLQNIPQVFAVGDKLEALRALKIADEFNKNYIIYGNGDAYQRIEGFGESSNATAREGKSFITPLNFPDAFDVADPYDSRMVDYPDMLHWELADANAVYLKNAGHQVAFTLDKLGDKEKEFFERLDRVRAAGMSEADLLRALTVTPASFVGATKELGTLENGKLANFTILDAWPVNKDSRVSQTWVQGQPFEVKPLQRELAKGTYRLTIGNDDVYLVKVSADDKAKVAKGVDTSFYDAKLVRDGHRISLSFPADSSKNAPVVRVAGQIDKLDNWEGMALNAQGEWVSWGARYDNLLGPDEDMLDKNKSELTSVKTLPALPKPFASYGVFELPNAQNFVVRNVTVWTNEDAGILESADVYVVGGKISAVGPSLKVANGTTEIDGTGKHLTSGIIDEHSHIAISRGVNEGSQESTAEVRIGDVVNSEDVNIYRHLAGGVTAIQQLHGSANPIGGQSALIKMRWGMLPEQLKIENADGFIKFALGENVKQSNWGVGNTRYPQTRMGVEQVYDDYFTRAAAYAKTPPTQRRRNLDLEALAEILNKERFITCHSYRQSEINMLMKVAERHDFRVNTFTHILEGYKVADKMAEHGVGASTFSDWWAYKFEVWDAIPENGAIMHEQGVTVAFNSDDAELGRRLNQEAGKAVQFGGLSEQEAWKFVTLNPAKLLHLDDRMGSVKAGKDADLVLWNSHPMSVYALAEKTWVDGALYYDRVEMKQRRARLETERNRLAQAMLADKNAGKRTQPVEAKGGDMWECDSL